jgi:uncharacterized membrane protein YeaQ/YmgE (transglycosylase-associated protein family)
MSITTSQIVVWLVVGALAGSVTGMLVTRSKGGYGRLANLGIGLVGALIGGVLFNVFRIGVGLQAVSINLQDLVSAFAGSLIFLAVLRWYKSRRARAGSKEAGRSAA